MAYYVYIMTNKWNTVLYTGVTGPLEQRIMQHKNKEIDGFTKRYNVTKLVYAEEFKYVNDAIEAEKRIKGWTRKKKITLIESVNPEWNNLFNPSGDSSSRSRGTQNDSGGGNVA